MRLAVSNQDFTYEKARQVAEESRESEWNKPSFAKELFLGRLRLDLVHPHPRSTPEQTEKGEAFLERLRDFCETQVDPFQIERDAKIPDHVVHGLAELGAFGMNTPEEYGGLGLSQVYYNRALMIANTAHSALGALLSAHQSIGVPKPVKLFGTEEQKKKYLPRLARGEISAFLLTEPDVGSDPARMGATAVPTEDGAAYILNGTKLWATNGVIADLMVVMAVVPKSEGHRGGISAFIVERDWEGVTIDRRNAFMGIRGIENSVTRFENVRVPKENLIWDEGRGLKIALVTLNTGRLSLPATTASAAKLCVRYAREWANERVQWGQPIGKHEAVAHKISAMAAKTFALEAVVELCGGLADDERNDIRLEAAIAKLYCSEEAWKIADDLVQIRGGRGFETAESLRARGEKPVPAEQILRDLRITRIFEGSTEIMQLFIAREALDTHLQAAGALADPKASGSAKAKSAAKAATFYAGWFPRLLVGAGQAPTTYGEFGELATHLRFVERSARRLARSTFYGMARWQAAMEHKQGYMGRIVDIGCELFAITAACVRAQMLIEEKAPGADTAAELADIFSRSARRRVLDLFHHLQDNDDSFNYKAGQAVLAGRFEWLEAGVIDPAEDRGRLSGEIDKLLQAEAKTKTGTPG
ncbi:MAG TPA: acyl-CoA dehydrogenase family protein [Candidatus Dormibacteraeota bacterium]